MFNLIRKFYQRKLLDEIETQKKVIDEQNKFIDDLQKTILAQRPMSELGEKCALFNSNGFVFVNWKNVKGLSFNMALKFYKENPQLEESSRIAGSINAMVNALNCPVFMNRLKEIRGGRGGVGTEKRKW